MESAHHAVNGGVDPEDIGTGAADEVDGLARRDREILAFERQMVEVRGCQGTSYS